MIEDFQSDIYIDTHFGAKAYDFYGFSMVSNYTIEIVSTYFNRLPRFSDPYRFLMVLILKSLTLDIV